jgi:hypothetical protein
MPLINEQGGLLELSRFDYELEAPDPSWNPVTTLLTCDDTAGTRGNCVRILYFVYYDEFSADYFRHPMLSDLLATIYTNEFVRAVGNLSR